MTRGVAPQQAQVISSISSRTSAAYDGKTVRFVVFDSGNALFFARDIAIRSLLAEYGLN